MLKKIHRVTKKKDFDRIFKQGRSGFGQITGAKALANGFTYSRFGIIVGLKISKKAVTRNKVKRKIREAIRNNLDKIEPGWDCVIITLPPIADKDFDEIEKAVILNLKKLHLFKNPR